MNALYLLAATLLWGFWGFADKEAVSRAHPWSIQWMYSAPYVLLLPVWYYLGRRAAPRTNADFSAMLWTVSASLASIAAMLCLFFAMRNKPASLAVAATSAYPAVTLILGLVRGTEGFNWSRSLGLAAIAFGVALLSTGQE